MKDLADKNTTTVECIFGLIEFVGNRAIIRRVDNEECVDENTAEDYCQDKISRGEYDSYVIPKHFYVGKEKGVLDYSFCAP